MKYLKLMGLAAIAAAALMAFAGTASATTLTGAGGATLGSGTKIVSENEGTVTLDPPFGAIECKESSVSGKTSNAGGTGVNVEGKIEALSWSSCNATVTVLNKGELSIEGTGSNNGLLRGTNNEVTVEFVGTHCIFKTNNTALGTVTGSSTTGKTATLDISATIPRTGGRSGVFCGSSAAWTGAYVITEPDTLNIDK
ncbi:MAG TPA: hypothetical protein VFX44_05780 [Solirubrobacterales bacterium]|nr:hypothetical protein [Solirubrobacterales bacterium]